MNTDKIIAHAKADCKTCHGSGVVYDFVPVPFGIWNCSMPSDCECALSELSQKQVEKIEAGEDFVILPADEATT